MSKHYLKYTFCFEQQTFSGEDALSWLEKGIGFAPTSIQGSHLDARTRTYHPKWLQSLAFEKGNWDLFLEGEGRHSLTVTDLAHPNYAQAVYLSLERENAIPPYLMEQLSLHPNLIVGYCCNEEDEYLQSASHSSHYKARNKSLAGAVGAGPEHFGEYDLDRSNNPGRRTMGNGYWLMSCWRMWFGQRFFEEVASAEYILAFPGEVRKERLAADRVMVELYGDAFDANKEENRIIQRTFRKVLKK